MSTLPDIVNEECVAREANRARGGAECPRDTFRAGTLTGLVWAGNHH